MVIKKKKSYKKQKGGLVIPKQILDYFDSIKYLINMFYEQIDLRDLPNSFERIEDLKINIETWIRSNNIYLRNLAIKIDKILKEKINTVNRYQGLILEILKCALLEVFFSLPTNKSKLMFPDILKKIFINILFIDYLNLDISAKNKNVFNEIFKEKIMKLLNILFHITLLDDKKYLIGLLRTLFLEEYQHQREYGIPVFYGNMSDSYNNNIRNLGYNQFICEKVGVSSKDKRNYIINPVGALAYEYIDKTNYLGTPLYNLLRKILRFDYVQGNKRRDSFSQLPKLEYLRQTTTKFCIAIDMFNNEEVYQEPTNDVSMCSKLYGCSLKMTAAIRPENIASDKDILELLSILLEEELNKQIPQIPQIQVVRPQIPVVRPKIPEVQINLNKEITTYNIRYHYKYFEKLQEEAYKLINNTKNNKNDIPKIEKLLIIIEDIETVQYPNNLNEYYKIYAPIIYEVKRYLELRLSYLKKNKTNKFYNTSTNILLKNENYNTTLDKIYREASIFTRNTRKYNPDDIRKIKKLLEIIKKIKSNKIKRFNFDNDMYQNLQERLDSIYSPNNYSL